jgi:hypothetical protein
MPELHGSSFSHVDQRRGARGAESTHRAAELRGRAQGRDRRAPRELVSNISSIFENLLIVVPALTKMHIIVRDD